MLHSLRIRNLAVIEAAEIDFEPGFSVLTGETGAGKSILVEAVGLLLGARASADLVRTGEPQATIEARFQDSDGAEVTVRREITSHGRSRSFVNGTAATAGALRALSLRLIEIHGQHEHQALLDPLAHLPLLDSHAGLEQLVARVAAAWAEVRELREQLERSRMDARERAARIDLVVFQLGEIEKARPKPAEDEELAAVKKVLVSAERLQRLCQESYEALYNSDQAVLSGLGGIWRRVAELSSIDPSFAAYLEGRDGIKSQLEDLAFFLRRYAEGVDASPARLQAVEDRLAALERLKRKYGPTLQDVIDRGEALSRERDLLTGGGRQANDVESELGEATRRFLGCARELSTKRRTSATRFAKEIEMLLADLAMAGTCCEFRFNGGELPPDRWGDRGIDDAEFFLSPNPGEDLRPLVRIVSGGELSRIMLALKTLDAGRACGKTGGEGMTLIFDEVDAGIGGGVAEVVGSRLRALAERFQVLCITHLAQIASRATAQFRIEKNVRGARTMTSVTPLSPEARVEEIARMIGGATVTAPMRASARELLSHAAGLEAKDKQKAKGESESRRVKG